MHINEEMNGYKTWRTDGASDLMVQTALDRIMGLHGCKEVTRDEARPWKQPQKNHQPFFVSLKLAVEKPSALFRSPWWIVEIETAWRNWQHCKQLKKGKRQHCKQLKRESGNAASSSKRESGNTASCSKRESGNTASSSKRQSGNTASSSKRETSNIARRSVSYSLPSQALTLQALLNNNKSLYEN